MFPFVEELMDEGIRVRITVTGMSMYPFLRDKKDSVELARSSFAEVQRGDILLVLGDDNTYVMHRLHNKKKDCFYINGDAQQWKEGPYYPNQIIAKVTTVWRENKCIPCTNVEWRVLVVIWQVLYPFRYIIINTYSRMHRLISSQDIRRNLH
jgi:hypothetical protein